MVAGASIAGYRCLDLAKQGKYRNMVVVRPASEGQAWTTREEILVTGASGMIGSGLCRMLEANGGSPKRTGRHGGPGIVGVGPVDGSTDWSAALAGCGAVVHLAAMVHDPRAGEGDILSVNVEGTLKLGGDAAAAGIRRFVFVSTAKVLGEESSPGTPFTEASAAAPPGAYARSKWLAEQGLSAIAERTGMELVVIRPPLVHGPGAKANLRSLMRAIDRGWPLPLGAVHNRRSLVGLQNLCGLIGLAIEHPAASGEVFLAADGEDVSSGELVVRLAAAMGRRARLLPVPPALLAMSLRLAGRGAAASSLLGDFRVDAGKARRLLGWSPAASLDAGLREMAAAYLGEA